MTRNEMMDAMIRLYGFEHPVVIQFCRLCEEWPEAEGNNKALEILVKKAHLESPLAEDDE